MEKGYITRELELARAELARIEAAALQAVRSAILVLYRAENPERTTPHEREEV